MKRILPADEFDGYLPPVGWDLIDTAYVGHGRWEIYFDIYLKDPEGRYWVVCVERPATEMQDVEHPDEWELHEVFPVQRIVTVYEEVKT